MDAHRDAVLEREPPVPGEVVGVRVRLDRADDADVALRGLLEVLLDREGRVDDDGVTGTGIADEVGGAAERVVDELREDHGRARPYQRLPLFLLKCRRAGRAVGGSGTGGWAGARRHARGRGALRPGGLGRGGGGGGGGGGGRGEGGGREAGRGGERGGGGEG